MTLRTKPFLYSIAFCFALTGCAIPPGGSDTRFIGQAGETFVVDSIPVKVTLIEIAPNEYDAEAIDARLIGFSGLNSPLQEQRRYRQALAQYIVKHFGADATYTVSQETFPQGWNKMLATIKVSRGNP